MPPSPFVFHLVSVMELSCLDSMYKTFIRKQCISKNLDSVFSFLQVSNVLYVGGGAGRGGGKP